MVKYIKFTNLFEVQMKGSKKGNEGDQWNIIFFTTLTRRKWHKVSLRKSVHNPVQVEGTAQKALDSHFVFVPQTLLTCCSMFYACYNYI